MKEKGKLEERIGIVEQQADLSKRIEATQRILDRKVETAAKTEFRSSKIINQSIGFAQISTGEIEPSATAIGWVQIILGAVIALFTTFLAPLFLQIAMPDLSGRRSQAEIQRSLSSVARALEAPPQPHHHPRGEGARDTRFDELLSRVRQFQMRTA